MEQILYILIWYLALSVPSFLVYFLLERKFGNFVKNNISLFIFSKAFFILFFIYVHYIFTLIGIFQNTREYIVLLYTIILLILLFLVYKNSWKPNWNWKIFCAEILTFLSYIFFIYVRSLEPKIEGIEKIMDFAILNSLIKSATLPPQDVWFSLEKINYYYFGHLIFSTFTILTGIKSEITYNLSVATIFSLVFSFSFGLIYFLTKKSAIALSSAFLIVFGGNMNYIFHILDLQNYYFADARSLMKNAITEFQAYSFIIGDLHAHILNIPFVLFLIFLMALYFKKNESNKYLTVLISFVTAILFGINSWDALTYCGLFGLLLLINFKKSWKDIIFFVSSLIVFIIPFIIFFKPAVGGIGLKINFDNTAYLFMFGHFLIIAIISLIYFLYKKDKKDNPFSFVIIALIYAILLSLFSQIFYFKDIYSIYNPPYYRANTIFKFWYQSFLIFSIFSPVVVYKLIEIIKFKKLRFIFYANSIGLFILFISYFYFGVKQFYGFGTFTIFPNIDGTKFLQMVDIDKYEAINFLNKNYKNKITILEKPGEAYTLDSTFSAFSGNPTPIGWVNHELGWRNNWNEILQIQTDIENIYKSKNTLEVKKLLEKYKIGLVVVDKLDNGNYLASPNSAIYKIGRSVYSNNSFDILSIK